jgi:lysophospholipase L1-like esterase
MGKGRGQECPRSQADTHLTLGRLSCYAADVKGALYCVAATLVAGLCGCGGGPGIRALEPDAVIVAFGDSLTSGYGAEEGESYPAVLAGLTGYKVINEGVPGEVSEEGARRLPAVLRKHKPALMILCHGGNDLLKGMDEAALGEHLQTMIEAARAEVADVILLGVPEPGLFLRSPEIYQKLARQNGIPYDGKALPEILAKGTLKSDLIHPNADGYRVLAQRVAGLIRKSQK